MLNLLDFICAFRNKVILRVDCKLCRVNTMLELEWQCRVHIEVRLIVKARNMGVALESTKHTDDARFRAVHVDDKHVR